MALVVLLTYQLAVVTLKSSGLALLSALLVSAAASTVRVFSVSLDRTGVRGPRACDIGRAGPCRRRDGDELYWLLIVAVAVTVATLFRFAGFALIPVVALGVALAFQRRGWIRAVSIGFAAASCCFRWGCCWFCTETCSGRITPRDQSPQPSLREANPLGQLR